MSKTTIKKTPSKVRVVQPQPTRLQLDDRTRNHRTINWVVSAILILFAFWSINLNAEGRSLLKQSVTTIAQIDSKIISIETTMREVKEACQATPIVIPTATIDGIVQ